MKRLYEKPEVEFVSFMSEETIADDDIGIGDGPSIEGGDADIWNIW